MSATQALEDRLVTRLEFIPGFLLKVEKFLEQFQLSQEILFQTKLALEEALTNAMRHGNKLNPSLFVHVRLAADKDRITIEVKDQGEGFDFMHVEDPTTIANIDKPSGRGVFLMKNLMDSVEFLENGCFVRMIKTFDRA